MAGWAPVFIEVFCDGVLLPQKKRHYQIILAFDSEIANMPLLKMVKQAISSKRILVVDDEPFVCEAVKMMLAFDGHSVKTTGSAKEALILLDTEPFDLVITDFAMPTMKGDELAVLIKARNPQQPVIMITAYAEMLQASGNTLPGVDCLIGKPFLLENLREAISKVFPE